MTIDEDVLRLPLVDDLVCYSGGDGDSDRGSRVSMKFWVLERYRKNFFSPSFPEVLVPRRICNQRSNGNQGTDSNDVADDDDDDDGGDDEKDDVDESSLSRAKPIFLSDRRNWYRIWIF